MSIRNEDVISWAAMRSGPKGNMRMGFMSQVSPDGQFVLTTMRPPTKGIPDNFYVINFKDYRFLQVFYPTRGGLAWYNRRTGQMHDLPGADDPRYVQTDGVWSPDGKYVVFARAEARDPYPEGKRLAEYANDPNETQMQYDLYRIPFNDGQGGQPEPIAGASENGMSNTFPKVSPDGRWIVFVKCRNGQLLRPDSQLYIIPAEGGEARRMRCNLPVMNSWHSFSPSGRWLIFSSKSASPYTQMYLTHLDEDGNDSPAILIENATAANRAVNIPEFLNISSGGLAKIDVPAAEFYREFDRAYDLAAKGQNEAAIAEWKKALDLDPGSVKAHNNLGAVLLREGKADEAIKHFQKALDVDPQLDEAHNNLGLALWEKGRLDEAIRHIQRALELEPGYARVYDAIISEPESRTGVSAPPGEELSRPKALRGNLENARARQQEREKLDAEYRRRLDAVVAYIRAPSSEPLEFESLVAGLDIPRLWKLADQNKDSDEVIAAQRQILRIFLRTFETGTLLLKENRNAQALMCFGIAAQAAPESPYIFYSLARAFALDNQDEKALKTLEKAAEKGFNDVGRVTGDRAFDGLRDHLDYRKAIAQMRSPNP
jgi:Tfp pilus assembly protein PilF